MRKAAHILATMVILATGAALSQPALAETQAALAQRLVQAANPEARLAVLADIVATAPGERSVDPALVTALKRTVADPDMLIRSRSGEAFALLSPVSKKALAEVIQLFSGEDDCTAVAGTFQAVTRAGDELYVPVMRSLRQAVLEHTGERHRARARRSLVRLVLARQGQRGAAGCEEFTPPDRFAALYQLANAGQAGADALLAALGDSLPTARLVAANSLQLTGVIPSDAMVEQLAKAVDRESDRIVKGEMLLALAIFAERSPLGMTKFRERLLSLADCDLAQSVAMTLPSHDLRLILYKKLPNSGRAADVRRWVRFPPFKSCAR